MAHLKIIALIAALFCTFWAGMSYAIASSRPTAYFYFAERDRDVPEYYADITPASLAGLLAQGVRPRDLVIPMARHSSGAALNALLAQPLPKAETQLALLFAISSKKDLTVLQALARQSPPPQPIHPGSCLGQGL